MGWSAQLKSGLRPLTDLVYPPRCPVCGEAVATQGGLCLGCWSGLETPATPACNQCQRPLGGSPGTAQTCRLCEVEPPRHAGIIAASVYTDVSRQLVLSLKHGGKIALAGLMGQMMAGRLPESNGADARLIVPVPLHRLRLWQRGFNQAALLASELARRNKGELCIDALIRRKRTPSLGGLGREERRAALCNAIAVRGARRDMIAGRDVLLVDDVYTSGATSSACVEALLDTGARSVRIVCFARVV